MSTQNRCEMKRMARKISFYAGAFVTCQPIVYIDGLVVKNEGQQIILGAASDITRFIDENRKLSHRPALSIKKPGDTPRRFRQAFLSESLITLYHEMGRLLKT